MGVSLPVIGFPQQAMLSQLLLQHGRRTLAWRGAGQKVGDEEVELCGFCACVCMCVCTCKNMVIRGGHHDDLCVRVYAYQPSPPHAAAAVGACVCGEDDSCRRGPWQQACDFVCVCVYVCMDRCLVI